MGDIREPVEEFVEALPGDDLDEPPAELQGVPDADLEAVLRVLERLSRT